MNSRLATLLVFLVTTLAALTAGATTYEAQPTRNGLEGSFPTRGFGDSNDVDVWVPFRISTPGASAASRATLTLVVKPIGQLVGTDKLMVRGASGTVHGVYSDFDKLPGDKWSRITVDVSGNADVMNAIRGGRLDGVVQDDTAVASITLTLAGATDPPENVYIFDVYYQGQDSNTGQPGWVRYQSYFDRGDATRAIVWLTSQGYTTTYQQRFWRQGRR